jgi:hypothetical protein
MKHPAATGGDGVCVATGMCSPASSTAGTPSRPRGLPIFEAGTVRPAGEPGHGMRLKPEVWNRPDAQRRRSGERGAGSARAVSACGHMVK